MSSATFFGPLLDTIPAFVSVVCPELRFVYINAQYEAWFRRPRHEIEGQPVAEVVGPENFAKVEPYFRRALAGEKVHFETDKSVHGRAYWLEATFTPQFSDAGLVEGVFAVLFDITEQKQAQKALEASEDRWKALIEQNPDIICLTDRDSCIRFINHGDPGMDLSQIRGRLACDFGSPEGREPILQAYHEAWDTREIRDIEVQAFWEGKTRWFATRIVPLVEDGTTQRILTVSHEITRRKQTEESLRESEALFRQVAGALDQIIWIVDLNPIRMVYVNAAFERMTGISAAEIYRDPWFWERHVPAEDRERVASYVTHPRATPYVLEQPFVTADGGTRCLLIMGFPIMDSSGKVTRLCGITKDITEQRTAERDREDREARIRVLLSLIPDLLFLFDQEGRFLECHHSNSADLLHPPENYLGKRLCEVVKPELARQMQDAIQKALKVQAETTLEYTLLVREKETPYEARFVPFGDDKVLAIIRNISEQKQAAEEKAALEKQWREAQKLESLGVMAGGVAHDFNNLLTGIVGNANLAQLEAPPDSALQSCLKQIEEISLRASELCKQMLAYAGRARFTLTQLSLNRLIEESMPLLQVSISKRAVLHFQLAANLPALMVDPTQLRQVLLNLVINASEAMEPRGGKLEVSTYLKSFSARDLTKFTLGDTLKPGSFLVLEVKDEGAGIRPEDLERIFEPFFSTKFQGRGLGLAAVHGILRSHQGAIRVATRLKRGTTFTILLPPSSTPSVEEDEPRLVAPISYRGSGLILIVDDEETVRNTLGRMMEALGFHVKEASDGALALPIFKKYHSEIRLVMLDMTMPVMNGEETLPELAKIDPNVPVVLMSGYTEHEMVQKFHDQATAGFLAKPFRLGELQKLVEEALRSKK